MHRRYRKRLDTHWTASRAWATLEARDPSADDHPRRTGALLGLGVHLRLLRAGQLLAAAARRRALRADVRGAHGHPAPARRPDRLRDPRDPRAPAARGAAGLDGGHRPLRADRRRPAGGPGRPDRRAHGLRADLDRADRHAHRQRRDDQPPPGPRPGRRPRRRRARRRARRRHDGQGGARRRRDPRRGGLLRRPDVRHQAPLRRGARAPRAAC